MVDEVRYVAQANGIFQFLHRVVSNNCQSVRGWLVRIPAMLHDLLDANHQKFLNQCAAMGGVLFKDSNHQIEAKAPCAMYFEFWPFQLAGTIAATQRLMSWYLVLCLLQRSKEVQYFAHVYILYNYVFVDLHMFLKPTNMNTRSDGLQIEHHISGRQPLLIGAISYYSHCSAHLLSTDVFERPPCATISVLVNKVFSVEFQSSKTDVKV